MRTIVYSLHKYGEAVHNSEETDITTVHNSH